MKKNHIRIEGDVLECCRIIRRHLPDYSIEELVSVIVFSWIDRQGIGLKKDEKHEVDLFDKKFKSKAKLFLSDMEKIKPWSEWFKDVKKEDKQKKTSHFVGDVIGVDGKFVLVCGEDFSKALGNIRKNVPEMTYQEIVSALIANYTLKRNKNKKNKLKKLKKQESFRRGLKTLNRFISLCKGKGIAVPEISEFKVGHTS